MQKDYWWVFLIINLKFHSSQKEFAQQSLYYKISDKGYSPGVNLFTVTVLLKSVVIVESVTAAHYPCEHQAFFLIT